MMRFLMPVILIGISAAVFFMFGKPIYDSPDLASPGIVALQEKLASYNKALDNSKSLEVERDKLTVKQNAIDPANLEKISKLLPENIDNIRLILEIEQIALPYGMALKNVKYSTASGAATATGTATSKPANAAPVPAGTPPAASAQGPRKDYGIWDLEFSTTATYSNFLNFTKDLESNLRIVDVASIQFSSSTGTGNTGSPGANAQQSYEYNFKIKTYWLKN